MCPFNGKGGGSRMKKTKKVRKKGGIILVVLLLLIGVVGYETVQVYGQIGSARVQEKTLSAQLQDKRKANADLRDDLAHADDEEFIKDLAREELGMAESGERIFYDVNN